LDGILVTSPFKVQVARFAARVLSNATRVGAVNALRREADSTWTADMFDGLGFLRGLQTKGHKVMGKQVLLFGLGGAGSAIAVALADAGAASITVMSPDAEKAKHTLSRLQTGCPACSFHFAPSLLEAEIESKEIIINASTVGMNEGDDMPSQLGPLHTTVVVGDIVLQPQTALLRHAAQCGCAVVTGYDMHSGQVQEISKFFHAFES